MNRRFFLFLLTATCLAHPVKAADPVRMAAAFKSAIDGGRMAYEAGLMEMRDMASPSTPVAGTPFFELRQK